MPKITTPRLELREMTLDDLDALHAVLSDPIAMQHYPSPFDLRVAERVGMHLEGEVDDRYGKAQVVYSMTPADRELRPGQPSAER